MTFVTSSHVALNVSFPSTWLFTATNHESNFTRRCDWEQMKSGRTEQLCSLVPFSAFLRVAWSSPSLASLSLFLSLPFPWVSILSMNIRQQNCTRWAKLNGATLYIWLENKTLCWHQGRSQRGACALPLSSIECIFTGKNWLCCDVVTLFSLPEGFCGPLWLILTDF